MNQNYLRMEMFHPLRTLFVVIMIISANVTACTTSNLEENPLVPESTKEGMNDSNMEGMDTEEDHDHDAAMREFTPNNGAEVHIITPANEVNFKSGDNVLVTIETSGFIIGENGNHWHIYLDGTPIMVMGGNSYVLQNMSAGHHDIEVYLSNSQHQDLEQGDKVTIMVEE